MITLGKIFRTMLTLGVGALNSFDLDYVKCTLHLLIDTAPVPVIKQYISIQHAKSK